jgi:hypothetical protein
MTLGRSAIAAAAIACFVAATPAAFAAVCPTTITPPANIFTVTGASGCFASGTGQVTGPGDPDFPFASLVYLDKTGVSGDPKEGALTVSTTPQTWSINTSLLLGYSNFVLLFQQSNSPREPDWGAFSLNATSGTWLIEKLTINPQGKEIRENVTLSHAILYGVASPTQTPLPGALVLFGTVVLGSGGIAGWRKRRARISA